jgi:phenylacetate-coenzyme A ligase PaaK-like adenylate-forming protein
MKRLDKNLRLALFDLQSGRRLGSALEHLLKHDELSRDELRQVSEDKLADLLRAISNHPYYRDFKPQTLDDIPAVGKSDILDNSHEWFIGKDISTAHLITTSGSTGKPFKFYETQRAGVIKRAARLRMFIRHGLAPYARELKLGGIVDHRIGLKEHLWRLVRNRFSLSSLDVSEEYCWKILRLINRISPTALCGYATTLSYFADWYAATPETKLDVKLPYVINCAEHMSEQTIAEVEQALATRVIDHYMASEGHIAHTCAHGSMHLDIDVCYFHRIGGELTYTNLYSHEFPLVNYVIGDEFDIDWATRCECGSSFPLITSFFGRIAEIYVTKSGRKLSQGDVNMLMAPYALCFAQYRLRIKDNHCTVEYVQRDERPEQLGDLTDFIRRHFELESVSFSPVSFLELKNTGKFSFIQVER